MREKLGLFISSCSWRFINTKLLYKRHLFLRCSSGSDSWVNTYATIHALSLVSCTDSALKRCFQMCSSRSALTLNNYRRDVPHLISCQWQIRANGNFYEFLKWPNILRISLSQPLKKWSTLDFSFFPSFLGLRLYLPVSILTCHNKKIVMVHKHVAETCSGMGSNKVQILVTVV